tara:strand:- start:1294 stop:1527 length:234 start_codon:yes stop_codon:yes gene_type:complete
MGNALFLQSKFFVDTFRLVDRKSQLSIKKYNYTKLTNTPPYPSIQQTPYTFVEDASIIDEEINNIQKIESEKNGTTK